MFSNECNQNDPRAIEQNGAVYFYQHDPRECHQQNADISHEQNGGLHQQDADINFHTVISIENYFSHAQDGRAMHFCYNEPSRIPIETYGGGSIKPPITPNKPKEDRGGNTK